MNILVLYGTETGNAEECSSAIADVLTPTHDVEVHDMGDFGSDRLIESAADYVLFVTATHGDGELAGGGAQFFDTLSAHQPTLNGTKFAVFGLGDSYYTTFNRAGETIAETLTGFGAIQVGQLARHDASSGEDPTEMATEWANTLLDIIAVPVPS